MSKYQGAQVTEKGSGLTRRIADASDVALIVDADGGYGNALNVMRTVVERRLDIDDVLYRSSAGPIKVVIKITPSAPNK